MANLDHLVIGARDLEQGIAWAHDILRVDIPRGGEHVKMSTHNCVMRLGGNVYFEIIAINPDAPPIKHPRWFGLDEPDVRTRIASTPVLLTWAVNTAAIAGGFEALRNACEHPPTSIHAMQRDNLQWQVAFPDDGTLVDGGLFPLVIEWAVSPHPARAMRDLGCRLRGLSLRSTDPKTLTRKLACIGALEALGGNPVEPASRNELVATLDTPAGTLELSSLGEPG